jgi:hypothetical protein
MVLSWAAMLKASQELVDPWDMARRFAPPSGTLAHTVRTTLQVLAPVIVITLMLLSVILLIRALRLTHGHPAISMAFLLTHAVVIWAIFKCYTLIPVGGPSYSRHSIAMAGFTSVLGCMVMIELGITRLARYTSVKFIQGNLDAML